jgi:hypothetical protein
VPTAIRAEKRVDGLTKVCVRALADIKISLESTQNHHHYITTKNSREHSEFADKEGIFNGRVVALPELPILLSISRRFQNHGSRLDQRCSTRGVCKADGAL